MTHFSQLDLCVATSHIFHDVFCVDALTLPWHTSCIASALTIYSQLTLWSCFPPSYPNNITEHFGLVLDIPTSSVHCCLFDWFLSSWSHVVDKWCCHPQLVCPSPRCIILWRRHWLGISYLRWSLTCGCCTYVALTKLFVHVCCGRRSFLFLEYKLVFFARISSTNVCYVPCCLAFFACHVVPRRWGLLETTLTFHTRLLRLYVFPFINITCKLVLLVAFSPLVVFWSRFHWLASLGYVCTSLRFLVTDAFMAYSHNCGISSTFLYFCLSYFPSAYTCKGGLLKHNRVHFVLPFPSSAHTPFSGCFHYHCCHWQHWNIENLIIPTHEWSSLSIPNLTLHL